MSGALWYRHPAQLWVEALPLYSIDSEGRLMEWQEELSESEITHRHVSRLFGLYPARASSRLEPCRSSRKRAANRSKSARTRARTGAWAGGLPVGGLEFDFEWSKGKLTHLKIKASAGA